MRPQLAEFNQDGIPEVYVGNVIFDALTGKRWVAFDAAKNSGKPILWLSISLKTGTPSPVGVLLVLKQTDWN
jgi:hypothetical protein